MESRGCGCGNCGGCGCGGGRMGGRAGSGNIDLTNDETAERLRNYKDDLTEEIKLIDKRIADLKAEDTKKGSK